jgi:hypothetical protein
MSLRVASQSVKSLGTADSSRLSPRYTRLRTARNDNRKESGGAPEGAPRPFQTRPRGLSAEFAGAGGLDCNFFRSLATALVGVPGGQSPAPALLRE